MNASSVRSNFHTPGEVSIEEYTPEEILCAANELNGQPQKKFVDYIPEELGQSPILCKHHLRCE